MPYLILLLCILCSFRTITVDPKNHLKSHFAPYYQPNRYPTASYKEDKRILIETGLAGGDGVYHAMQTDFSEIYSIEYNQDAYSRCLKLFANFSNVHLFCGDSAEVLNHLLPSIHEPVVFWLDAHASVETMNERNCPILRELKAIKAHDIKTHTILVDDIRCFSGKDYDSISVEQIIQGIKEINPDYEISVANGFVENDVLVARIPNKSRR